MLLSVAGQRCVMQPSLLGSIGFILMQNATFVQRRTLGFKQTGMFLLKYHLAKTV